MPHNPEGKYPFDTRVWRESQEEDWRERAEEEAYDATYGADDEDTPPPDPELPFCYLEYDNIFDRDVARRSGRLGRHNGNVVMVFPAATANPGRWQAITAVYFHANSAVCHEEVSTDYLFTNCRAISIDLAEEIHPALFDQWYADYLGGYVDGTLVYDEASVPAYIKNRIRFRQRKEYQLSTLWHPVAYEL